MSMPRILIVEDESKISDHLVQALTEENFSTFTCDTYKQLLAMIDLPVKRFDIVILDRLLQGHDAASLIHQLKEKMGASQVLVLSAIGTAAEKAIILDKGADDYISKPFDTSELVARVKVLLRRNSPTFRFSNMTLNVETRALLVGELEVALTNKEFNLLKTLVQIPGKVFSKSALTEKVWEMSADVESNVVEATVNKLRHRLKEAGANIQIKNARNIGYWVEE